MPNKLTYTESKDLFAVCRVDHLLLQKTNTYREASGSG